MRRKKDSFTGTRPIFTGSPSIVPGGFNLDKSKQKFSVDDVIPAGTLAIMDEEKRTVQVIKTAKVTDIKSGDKKIVTLMVDEFFAPCFVVGDKVLKTDAISGPYASAPAITAIDKDERNSKYVITLSAEISNLKKGDVIVEVVENSSNAAERGKANCVLIADVVVGEFETSVDVSADTMQYAMYERRVPAIPPTQKDATGMFLAANPHVKLTKSN